MFQYSIANEPLWFSIQRGAVFSATYSGRSESDAAFWKFVGNPMHRMHEKRVAENCRASEEYKKRLFEKIDLLINEFRSDKQLLREREERRKNKYNK